MSSARAGRAFRIAGVVCAVGLQPTCTEPPPTDADHPARRIVSLVPAATEILVALGARDRLVGRAADDPTPGAAGAPRVGSVLAPTLERVAALAPDLILVPPELPLAGLGSLARVEVLRIDRLGEVVLAIERLGRWTGHTEEARRLADSIQSDLDLVAALVSGRPAPTALWIVSGRPPVAAGPGTYLDDLLRLAGGVNVLADSRSAWPVPSPEVLAERGPALIVWSAPDEPDGGGPWRAVPDAPVHRLDPDLFHQPGPRVAEAARRLAELLHPDIDPSRSLPPHGILP